MLEMSEICGSQNMGPGPAAASLGGLLEMQILGLALSNLQSQNFFFFFLGLHLQHVEVSRLGVELELQLLAYATTTLDLSCICAGSLTHGARPGIEPASSRMLVGFITAEPQRDLPRVRNSDART